MSAKHNPDDSPPRDICALVVLHALLCNEAIATYTTPRPTTEQVVERAYQFADAMAKRAAE